MNKLAENQAVARGRDLPISTKKSIDVCRHVKGRTLKSAKEQLQRVLDMKNAVAATAHRKDIPHRPGFMAGGRYPQIATKKILEVIELAEKNAQNKGLNVNSLIIKNIRADKAANPMRGGRQGRHKTKRTHIEVIVEEQLQKKEDKKEPAKKTAKKETAKEETTQ